MVKQSSRSRPALCLLALLSLPGCSLLFHNTLDDAKAVVGSRNDYLFLKDRYERRCGSSLPKPSVPVPMAPSSSSQSVACTAAFNGLNLWFDDLKGAGEGVDHKGPIKLWSEALKSDLKVCLSALHVAGADLP